MKTAETLRKTDNNHYKIIEVIVQLSVMKATPHLR